MKLVFPNGESEQVTLKQGENVVGSDDGCDVVLKLDGIAADHALITISGNGGIIAVKDATNITRVNGTLVVARTPVKAGDALLFSAVQCQVVGAEGQVAAAPPPAPEASAKPKNEASQTIIRAAIPKFLLRGVSGSTFGKNYPLHGEQVIGRHSDCDICLPADEVSRRHAKITVTPVGLMIEDLGSSNGTFINGDRVEKAELKGGDELRLDMVRFLVQSPGMEPPAPTPSRSGETTAVPEEPVKSSSAKWAIILVLVIAAAVLGLKLSGTI
ncbi:MAG: FHA domain-containing protein [Lysobacterales bacterium]